MSSIARQTSEAFGDAPSRDFEAEFGATVASKISTAKVGPVLTSAAPKPAAKPVMAPIASVALSARAPVAVKVTTAAKAPTVIAKAATTAAASAIKVAAATVAAKPAAKVAAPALVPAGMKAPSAVEKAKAEASLTKAIASSAGSSNVVRAAAVPTPKPTSSAKPTGNATTAQTGNFLDGGGAPLAMPNVQLSAAQRAEQDAKLLKLKASEIRAAAEKTAAANAAYARERQAADLASVKRSNEAPTHKASVDWGLIPAGAAVIAAGAAVIATGGVAAGAIAAPSAAGLAGAAIAADRALAAVEKAKLVPKGAAGKLTAVVNAGATAQAVLDNTLKLAEQGNPAALAGVKVIADTALQRIASGAIPGVPQALTPQGSEDYSGYLEGAPTGLQAAVVGMTPTPNGYNTTALSTRPAAAILQTRKVAWFVSTDGKVTRGDVLLGKGFRVYADGQVVKK